MNKVLRHLVVLLSAAVAAGGVQGAEAERPGGSRLPRLSSPELLNLWGEQPDAVQELYAAAYEVLSARRDATFADVADDPAVRRICEQSGIRHFGGPMLGCAGPDGAKVWLRTSRPAKVEVRVEVDGGERTFGPVESTPESDLTAIVPVTGLEPATRRYPYRVLVDGVAVPTQANAAISTAPAEQASVRIAFGTCSHRFGLGNAKLSEAILARKPAAMLLCGDVAVQDRNNHLGLHRADYLLRDFYPAWQSLSAAVPVYAGWDDHDYFDNDKWGIPKGFTADDRASVRGVFRLAWNNPAYGFGNAGGGIFFRTRIGPCDVILTDGRYFRTKGSMLGEKQMAWLERQLIDCKGPFIILASSTMWSDYVSNGKDSWGVYDREGRERLFDLIEKHRIGGVLLISGDRHGARGFRIPRPSGFCLYEFEAASLGGIDWGPKATAPDAEQQLFGHLGYAFGEFTIDAAQPDPTVTFRLIGDDGQVIYETVLIRSQLTPRGS